MYRTQCAPISLLNMNTAAEYHFFTLGPFKGMRQFLTSFKHSTLPLKCLLTLIVPVMP